MPVMMQRLAVHADKQAWRPVPVCPRRRHSSGEPHDAVGQCVLCLHTGTWRSRTCRPPATEFTACEGLERVIIKILFRAGVSTFAIVTHLAGIHLGQALLSTMGRQPAAGAEAIAVATLADAAAAEQ
jgi:hypothetical protein